MQELAMRDEKIVALKEKSFLGKNESVTDQYFLSKTFKKNKNEVYQSTKNIFQRKWNSLKTNTTQNILRDITNTDPIKNGNSIQMLGAKICKPKTVSQVDRLFDAKRSSCQSDFKYRSQNSSQITRISQQAQLNTTKNGFRKCGSVKNLFGSKVSTG